jgi:hypothetical protein
MASKYADVIKGAKDLLSKSFNYNNKVEVKSTTPTGVTFTAEAVVSKPASASINASGASGSFKVDKLQVATDKKIVGEFSLVESFPGTKLTFKATDGSRAAGADAISAVIGAEYKDASGRSVLTVDADAIKAGVDATLLVAYEGVLLGATAKSSLAAGFSVTDYGVLVGYKTKAYTVSAAAEKKMTTVTASYLQVVSPTITTAAIAKFPLAAKASPAAFDIEAGLSYRAAADTTVTAKVNSAGKVAVSYAQQLSTLTKLTFASEVDAANVASDDHKFGVLLNITA